jgi:hypothetical protein
MTPHPGGDVLAREKRRLGGLSLRRRVRVLGVRRELSRLGPAAGQNEGVRLDRSKARGTAT